MKRKRIRELYALRTVTDPLTGKEREEALYQGDYYQLAMNAEEKHGLGITLALLGLIAILLFLCCGLLDSPGSRCFYVLPFFLLMTFPLFYACMAVFRFAKLPQPFTEVQKEHAPDSLVHSCGGLIILSSLYALGDLLFIALGKAQGQLMLEIAALLCVLGIGAVAAIAYRKVRDVKILPASKDSSPLPTPSAGKEA